VPQKKLAQSMPGAEHVLAHVPARPQQVPDRLLPSVRHGDQHQHSGAMELGELSRVAPVGFDPLARLDRQVVAPIAGRTVLA